MSIPSHIRLTPTDIEKKLMQNPNYIPPHIGTLKNASF